MRENESTVISFRVQAALKDNLNLLAAATGTDISKLLTDCAEKIVEANQPLIDQMKQFRAQVGAVKMPLGNKNQRKKKAADNPSTAQ